jgi:16S rRNA (cytosine967-C5)-methyltransferase
MNPSHPTKPLPEKVIRRLEQIFFDLLPALNQAVQAGRPVDVELNQWMREHRELGSRDRRFLSQAVFRHYRWYGWTHHALQLDLPAATLLSALLEESETTQWIEHLSQQNTFPEPLEPLGQLTLEEKIERLTKTFQISLSATQLITPDAPEVIDAELLKKSLPAFQQRMPLWIRTRATLAALQEALSAEKINATPHPFAPNTLSIPSGINLKQKLSACAGQFVVQDLASQCVAHVCAPIAGQLWWDACAGSGGKALHLADLMKQQGAILASDPRPDALNELKKRARACGIRTIQTQTLDATQTVPGDERYDGVLLDAPCSGWGTWSRSPDARWRTSLKDVRQATRRQAAIFNNAAQAVKPGGVLIYAVCTITIPETTEQLAAFLTAHPEFELEPFHHPLTGEPTNGTLQLIPSRHDGMFIARLRKQAATTS